MSLGDTGQVASLLGICSAGGRSDVRSASLTVTGGCKSIQFPDLVPPLHPRPPFSTGQAPHTPLLGSTAWDLLGLAGSLAGLWGSPTEGHGQEFGWALVWWMVHPSAVCRAEVAGGVRVAGGRKCPVSGDETCGDQEAAVGEQQPPGWARAARKAGLWPGGLTWRPQLTEHPVPERHPPPTSERFALQRCRNIFIYYCAFAIFSLLGLLEFQMDPPPWAALYLLDIGLCKMRPKISFGVLKYFGCEIGRGTNMHVNHQNLY